MGRVYPVVRGKIPQETKNQLKSKAGLLNRISGTQKETVNSF
jgi:hypothetical protein